MKTIIVSLVFVALSTLCRAEQLPQQIQIGFTPSGNTQVMERAIHILAEALSKELGTKVLPILAKNYGALSEQLSSKKIDFAFLSSQSFVVNEQKAGLKVLLKKVWQAPFYHSVILVPSTSKLSKVTDLRGHRIAFVDKSSTSGYLYPQVEFQRKSLQEKDFKEILFSGSHAQSVALLEAGKVDAIAVFSDDLEATQSAWQKFGKSKKKVRKIWASDPIPNDPFCVRQEFYDQYPKFTHTLMFALIDVVESKQKDTDIKALLGANGFQPATSRQYDAVRDMVKALNLKSE